MLMVPCSRLWIFPENHFKGSTSPGGDRTETCSPRFAQVPGTAPLWEGCVRPGLAVCPRTRAFLAGSCAQPCRSRPFGSSFFGVLFPALVFMSQVSCCRSSQGWGPGIGVVHFLTLAQIPAQPLAESSPPRCALVRPPPE